MGEVKTSSWKKEKCWDSFRVEGKGGGGGRRRRGRGRGGRRERGGRGRKGRKEGRGDRGGERGRGRGVGGVGGRGRRRSFLRGEIQCEEEEEEECAATLAPCLFPGLWEEKGGGGGGGERKRVKDFPFPIQDQGRKKWESGDMEEEGLIFP